MGTLESIIPKGLFLGELIRVHGLGVIPILTEEIPDLSVLEPLEAALSKGTVRIGETSESGEVPFLLLENTGDLPVLVLDGEEVVGGKQNRIINTTLIILAHSTSKIPVSCIQAGRWAHETANFEAAKSVFRARSRAVQKATVTANVRESGSFLSDQSAVWGEVSASLHELGVHSPTSDFREGRELVAPRLQEFVEAVQPAERQIGAIFVNSGGVLGMEMLGTPALFSQAYEKVIRSFAFEVMNAPDLNEASIDGARQWWDEVLHSEFSRHVSPAAGEDIRIGTQDLIGSGLLWSDVLVHFSAFPDVRMQSSRPSSKRASARQRRQNLRSTLAD